MSQSQINSRDLFSARYSSRSTRDANAFASRALYSQRAHILPDRHEYAGRCAIIVNFSIVTPTQPPYASDRDNSPVHYNPASVHSLSVVHKKPRVPVNITTAANRSKSPVSNARSEEFDIVIAARSFRNSFGDNSRRSTRSFCGAVKFRARRTTLLTESHAQCVHSDSHAPRANSTDDDRHSLLGCVYSSALKAVPKEHVRNPLREPDSNYKARDSPPVQMFASRTPTSCTAQPVSPLSPESSIVSRVWQHRETVAKSARAQILLAAHDMRITPSYINCDSQSSESNRLLLNPFLKLSPSKSQVVIFDCYLNSSLSPVFRREPKLPIVMSLLADTQLFADVPTSLGLLNTAREQLKSFPIIDVVILGLDQEFTESIVEKHFVTVREFLLDAIAKFGPDLGGLYSAALLYSD